MRLRSFPDVFRADDNLGQHVCRVAARVACLGRAMVSRKDSEGLDRADVEAASTKVWKRWKQSIVDPDEVRALRSWRGGCVSSPSRNQSHRSHTCHWCGVEWASARHLWAECPRFAPMRLQLEKEMSVPAQWWAEQPRCTSKSGWVTVDAAPSVEERGARMVAACRLGMAVVAACWDANTALDDEKLQKRGKSLWYKRPGKGFAKRRASRSYK